MFPVEAGTLGLPVPGSSLPRCRGSGPVQGRRRSRESRARGAGVDAGGPCGREAEGAAVDVALHVPYLLVGSVEAGTYQQLSGFTEKIL